MDEATAKLIVMVGAVLGAVFWLIGLHAYNRIVADKPQRRTRVPVRSSGPDALAELLRWGTLEGRQVTEQSGRSVSVRDALCDLRLALVDDASGPVLEITADFAGLRRRYVRMLGILVLGVAPLVLAGLVIGLYGYAAPSPNPGHRGQVFQILQCVHVLWPPLVFGHQYRVLRRRLQESVPRNLQALIAAAGNAPQGNRP